MLNKEEIQMKRKWIEEENIRKKKRSNEFKVLLWFKQILIL